MECLFHPSRVKGGEPVVVHTRRFLRAMAHTDVVGCAGMEPTGITRKLEHQCRDAL